MRHFIENHFGLLFLISCIGGLIIPGMGNLPNETATLILAALMFISCYKLEGSGLAGIRWRDVSLFYVLRYVLLPPVMWAIAHVVAPDYATGVFLLSTLPAAVSSPALSAIYGGAVPASFAIVIISQLLTPFMIPLQFALMGNVQAAPSPAHLFATMVWCIFVPMIAYALVRRQKHVSNWAHANGKLASMLLIAFVIALAVAKQRDVILSNHIGLLVSLVITLICFTAYMLIGWYAMWKCAREERITFATCSAFNNAALGVSLALLHFPPNVILFVAVSEIGWSLLPLLFKKFLKL